MTEQEAIEIHIAENIHRIEVIEDFIHTNSDADDAVCRKNIAVLSKINGLLQIVQQYRAIGTVEELKEAKEQYDNINCAAKSVDLIGLCNFEIAKKGIVDVLRNANCSEEDNTCEWELNDQAKIYKCPHSGKCHVRKMDKVPYCQYCGKRIKVV